MNSLSRFFPAILASVLLFVFIVLVRESIKANNSNRNCQTACGIYVSKIIDDQCYCKTMPQSYIQYNSVEVEQ